MRIYIDRCHNGLRMNQSFIQVNYTHLKTEGKSEGKAGGKGREKGGERGRVLFLLPSASLDFLKGQKKKTIL